MGSGAPLPTLQSIRTQRSVPAAGSERIRIPISIVPLHTIVPGRARLKIGGLRGAPDLAALLQRGLIGFGGVHGVLASALTGNITLRYKPTSSLDRLIEHIGGLLRGEVTPALHDPAERQWHASETQAIACELGTSCSHGFSATRAKEELARVGANTFRSPSRASGLLNTAIGSAASVTLRVNGWPINAAEIGRIDCKFDAVRRIDRLNESWPRNGLEPA